MESDEEKEPNCNNIVTEAQLPKLTTTSTTTQKNIVVDDSVAGFKLKLKTSAKEMGIDGEYYSAKLKHNVSVRELQILSMLVLAEAANEPHDAQVSVTASVLNRVLNEKFPNTIEEVIVQPAQFSPVIMKNPKETWQKGWNGFYHQGGKTEVLWQDYSKSVTDSVLQSVYNALDGADPTECVGGALYYCNYSQLTNEELEYRSTVGEIVTFGWTSFYRDWN